MDEKRRYVNAEHLTELFRDMADFAGDETERRMLLFAADTVDDLPGVLIPEALIPKGTERKEETAADERMFEGGYSSGSSGLRNAEGYADPTVYAAMKNMEKKRKERARDG